MQVFTQNLAEIDIEKLVSNTISSPKNQNRESFNLTPLIENVDKEEFEYLPDSTESLNTVLFDYWFSGDYLKMASSALITTGNRLAVSKDLIKIIESYPERPFKIFSSYTWEGSHILIQVLPEKKGIRAVLLSTESAIETRDVLFSANTNFNGSTFWLCDLSGSVSATNDTKTTIYMNILEFMPSSRILFFDLLIFNGSLNHILTNKNMKRIYYTKWLKSENYKYRALFLLLRMQVLAKKGKYIMADNSIEMTILNRAARGDKEILNGIKMTSGVYKKPPITKEVEEAYFTSTGKSRPASGSSGGEPIDSFEEIYTTITKFAVPILSGAHDLTLSKFSSTNMSKVDAESDKASKANDKLDFFDEGNSLSKNVKYWLDVFDNKEDVNNFVADPKKIRDRPKLPIEYDPDTNGGGPDGYNGGADEDSDSDDESDDDSSVKKKRRPVKRKVAKEANDFTNLNESTDSNATEGSINTAGIVIFVIVIIGAAGITYYYTATKNKNFQVNPAQEIAPKHDENGNEHANNHQQSYNNYQGYTQNDYQNQYNYQGHQQSYQGYQGYQQSYQDYQHDYQGYPPDHQQGYQQDYSKSPYQESHQADYEQLHAQSPNPKDNATTSAELPPSYDIDNSTVHLQEKDPENKNFKN